MWVALLLAAVLPTTRLELTEVQMPCRVEVLLPQRVVARLGRDPFTNASPNVLKVTFRREGTFVALLESTAEGVTSQRRIESTSCEELVDSVAFIVSLSLETIKGPARVVEPPQPRPLPAPAPPSVPHAELWAGPSLALGLSGPLFGGRFGGSLRGNGPLAFGLEGRVDGQPDQRTPFGAFVPLTLSAAALLCLQADPFRACVGAGASVFAPLGARVRSGAVATSALAALKAGWRFPLGPLFFRPELELGFVLPPPTLEAAGVIAWRASLFFVGLNLNFGRAW